MNYAAGDAVEEGAVIVTVEDGQGSSIDYTAPLWLRTAGAACFQRG